MTQAAAARPALRELADRLGIEAGYVSALDRRFVSTSDDTREALSAAMGFDASSEAAAVRALERLDASLDVAEREPVSCPSYRDLLGGARLFGWWTNLYSLRSDGNLGFGNLGDVRRLVQFAAGQGAAFVGLNPLHALTNRADGVCPYAPVSRLYRNPLYIDVERALERNPAPEARVRLGALSERIAALRDASSLDPRAVEEVLFAVLRPVHAWLRRAPEAGEARRRYASYRRGQGDALVAFATFQALADANEADGRSRDWRSWPAEQRNPDSAAVRAFRERHASQVDFHAWLQFELDTQLVELGEECERSGLALGLYADLALGSAAGGFDDWAHPQLFARGVSVGAPPDAFSRAGQDWGFPPLDPQALRRDGFAFWRRVIESSLRGAGALRVDHALGLRRLFWIPEGEPPSRGTYVRSPELDLVSVLGETSRRLGGLVIGEDLGTVPEGFSQEIQDRGMLSSRVLLFERDAEGFHPSRDWPEACLATVNTHDLPPLAAWLSDEDVALRRSSGQIPDDATCDEIRAERREDREALRRRLIAEGCLVEGTSIDDLEGWSIAVTRFLCRTPSVLVGLSLDDLAGERTPINLPGVPQERHRSWVRRMQPSLDDLFADARVRRMLAAVSADRRAFR